MNTVHVDFDIGYAQAKPYTVLGEEEHDLKPMIVYRLKLEPASLAITSPAQMIRLGSALLKEGLDWQKEVDGE